MPFITVRNLQFEYTSKRVLKDVSFQIEAGSVTALVGPNGAGKTTLLRCMTTLETPLSGSVVIDGLDVNEPPREANRSMAYLTVSFGLYDELTVRQCLTYMAWCHQLPAAHVKARVEQVAEQVEITQYLDQKAGILSRGYRQRLGVGLALVHEPKLLLLDEPASGMDPEARIQFSNLILKLKHAGMTILVSSHILAELEDYCTDMLVIRDGEVTSHISLSTQMAEAETVIHLLANNLSEQYLTMLSTNGKVHAVQQAEGGASFTFAGSDEDQAALLSFLIAGGLQIHAFVPERKTLKSAYMDLAKDKGRGLQ